MDEMRRCSLCLHMSKAWCERTGKYPYPDEAERCNLFEKDYEAIARDRWLEIGEKDAGLH